MAKLSIETIAEMINNDCIPGRYFWACGLVRETAKLWATPNRYALLCPVAQSMADHYLSTPRG